MDSATQNARGKTSCGGKYVAQMRAEETANALAAAALTFCLYCHWSHYGTVAEGRAAHRTHRRKAHR